MWLISSDCSPCFSGLMQTQPMNDTRYRVLSLWKNIEYQPDQDQVNSIPQPPWQPSWLSLAVFLLLLLQCIFTRSSTVSFEWPSGRRPPCTTMPWNIWPSLMVLWGVCWMFYTPLSDWDWENVQDHLNDHDLDFNLDCECLCVTFWYASH